MVALISVIKRNWFRATFSQRVFMHVTSCL